MANQLALTGTALDWSLQDWGMDGLNKGRRSPLFLSFHVPLHSSKKFTKHVKIAIPYSSKMYKLKDAETLQNAKE